MKKIRTQSWMYRGVGWRNWGEVNMIRMHCTKVSKNKGIFKLIYIFKSFGCHDWVGYQSTTGFW